MQQPLPAQRSVRHHVVVGNDDRRVTPAPYPVGHAAQNAHTVRGRYRGAVDADVCQAPTGTLAWWRHPVRSPAAAGSASPWCSVFLQRVSRRVSSVSTVRDRKSTRLNSSHGYISYAVFCLKKKKKPM